MTEPQPQPIVPVSQTPGVQLTMFPAPLRWTANGRRRVASWDQFEHLAEVPSLWPAEPTIAASEDLLVGLSFARLAEDTRVLARDVAHSRAATEARIEDVGGIVVEYVDEPLVDEDQVRRWWGRWAFVAYTTAYNEQPFGDRPPGPRWRVLVPLSRPVPLERARRLVRWARHPRRGAGSVDATTEDLTRVVAVPAVAPGGYEWCASDQPLLDPDFVDHQLARWADQDREIAASHAVADATIEEAVDGFRHRIASPQRRALLPWPGGVETLPRNGEIGPVPVPHLDELATLAGSLWPGRIAVLVGHSGSGRSSLALQIAEAAARCGHPVLYASGGLPMDEIVARLLVIRSAAWGPAVPPSYAAVLEGRAEPAAIEAACVSLQTDCASLFPWAPTTRDRTDEALRARVLGVTDKVRGHSPLVIVDPVEGFDDQRAIESTYRELSAAARDLARGGSLSADYPGAAVLVVVDAPHDLNEALCTASGLHGLKGDPRGQLELAERLTAQIGGLGSDASLVLALATDRGDADVRDAAIAVLKNRHGHPGVVRLRFHGAAGVFDEAAARSSPGPW